MSKTKEAPSAGAAAGEAAVAQKAPKTRSPNYPFLSLRDAASKIKPLFDAMRRHATGVEVAVKAMGYSPKSSSGRLAMAAMRAFGLLDDAGTGMVQLSHRALDIGIDSRESSPEWRKAVRDAALSPMVHQKLWERYHADLPSDDELRRYLIRELKFNDNVVGQFISEYKETLDFSGLAKSDMGVENGLDESTTEIKVGDYVQWTSAGVDQFSAPRRVLEIAGENGEWAFVEGSPTGIPMNQLTVVDQPSPAAPAVPPVNPFHAKIPAASTAMSQSRASGSPTISLQIGDFQEFPIYTPSGKGTLSVPAQMTKKAFELLKLQIQNSLCVIEATAIVEDQAE